MNYAASFRLLAAITCVLIASAVSLARTTRCQEPKPGTHTLRTLDDYFPFSPPKTIAEWESQRSQLRDRLLVSLGLWPLPEKTPLNPVRHSSIDRGDYLVEKVFFESMPGFFVTGNLYRPKHISAPAPGVLCPHGHWNNGRFLMTSNDEIQREIASGAEQFESNARSVLQARCATLARMGCVVFHYDMIGNADSQQIPASVSHGFSERRPEMEDRSSWGLFSPQAELRFQSVMGLQTWNSIRALDFLESLPEVDRTRIGVTGASGGGTQTFILGAIDPRPSVAFPAVMVSTGMQGGCTCENCCNLRIDAGNVAFAAMFAPKPMGLTAANDWTKEMTTKGFPELQQIYRMYGHEDCVHLTSRIEFGHNYNQVSREAMYAWFNTHLKLGLASTAESPMEVLPPEQLTVFDEEHPRPEGGPDFERTLMRQWDEDSRRQLSWDNVRSPSDQETLVAQLHTAFACIIAHRAGTSKFVHQSGIVDGDVAWREEDFFTSGNGLETRIIKVSPATADDTAVKRIVIVLTENGIADWKTLVSTGLGSLVHNDDLLVGIDLVGQGVLADSDNPKSENRLVQNGRRAAAYTFGYNRSVLAQRAAQVIDLVKAFRAAESNVMDKNASPSQGVLQREIWLVSTDRTSPIACVASTALNANELTGMAVATNGFRFESQSEFEDPNFLPGVVKYGDLHGCLSLEPQRRLLIANEDPSSMPDVLKSYELSGLVANLRFAAPKTDSELWAAIREWITKDH